MKQPFTSNAGIENNKAKGNSLENYMVKKFDRNYFTIQEWRSDKYAAGVYAVSNQFPDLEILFVSRKENVKDSFAVECKWRKSFIIIQFNGRRSARSQITLHMQIN